MQALLDKLPRLRLTLLGLFAACVATTTQVATNFMAGRVLPETGRRQDAAAAGFVLLSLVNFLMILLLGSVVGDSAAAAAPDAAHAGAGEVGMHALPYSRSATAAHHEQDLPPAGPVTAGAAAPAVVVP
jgi:hypothetical protein